MEQECIMLIMSMCGLMGGVSTGRRLFVASGSIAKSVGCGLFSTAVIIIVVLYCWFLVDSHIDEEQ